MKTIFLFLSFFLFCNLNAATYYVDASKTDNSGLGTSWSTAKQTIASAMALATSGDNIFVKAGTFNYTTTFTPATNVNFYGGFSGTETSISERLTSDLDGNGIVESWEFTYPTTISFAITTDVVGLSISNTALRSFDGFTITGSYNSPTSVNQVINLGANCLFQNNTVSGFTVGTTITAQIDGLLLKMNGAPTTVSNCLFENNTVAVTAGTGSSEFLTSPFMKMQAASGSNRRLFTNSIIRKNVVNIDYTVSTITSGVYNTRGTLFSMDMSTSTTTAYNTIKNNLIYNNEVTFIPASGMSGKDLGSGLIYPYNINTSTQQDSIVNNTIANNKMIRIGSAIYVGTRAASVPAHRVLNNVLYNNKNTNNAGTTSDNSLSAQTTPTTTAGVLIANNYCTGSIISAVTNTVVNNKNDLSGTNNQDASKGAWFTSPSTVVGIVGVSGTDLTSINTARWTIIESSSYLKGKGVVSLNKTDKADHSFASTPSVGAYEQCSPTIIGATTTATFTSTYGTASSSQSFAVSGSSLFSIINAIAPTGYEISTNGSTYGSTASISQSAGNASGNIYVRLKATQNTGNYNGQDIVLSTTDGSSVNITTPASGNVINPKPLSISAPVVISKTYDGTNESGEITYGTLSGFVGNETVTVSTAIGTFADANVGTNKLADITYTLANGTNGGLATNYSLANGSATGNITAVLQVVSTSGSVGNSALLPGTDIIVQPNVELTVNNTSTIHSIIINPLGKLTLESGSTLNSGMITLQSDGTGTGTFVDNNVIGGLSTVANVQQYLPQGRNWYVSTPVEIANNTNLISGGASSVSYYDENESGWINNYTGALTPGLGYIAVSNSGTATNNISFNGSLNSGEITIPVTNSGTSYTGFNLLGNPYISYLNSELFFATNTFLRPTIWYRTKESGSYTFQTFNAAGNVSVPASTSGYIPPMQGFWVRANSAGTVTFANTMRSHGDGNSNPLKAPNVNKSERQLLRLEISNGANTDETVLYFNSLASNGYDNYDSPKRFNKIESYPEIYSKIGNEKLVINGLAEIKDDIESPLGFRFEQAADLKLKVTELTNIGITTKVYLLDKSAETETELQVGTEYAFNTGFVSNNESRFSLLFKVQGATTGFEDKRNDRISVFVNAQNEIIILSDENMNYSVFNTMGQKVAGGITESERTIVKELNKGSVYFVGINGITEKVIFK